MKQLKITAFFICLLLMGLIINANSQTVKKDANGNFFIEKLVRDSTTSKPTGKTFTTSDGTVYPVMISKNGKLFVIRTSKSGVQYKQYLKLEN